MRRPPFSQALRWQLFWACRSLPYLCLRLRVNLPQVRALWRGSEDSRHNRCTRWRPHAWPRATTPSNFVGVVRWPADSR